jgi:hypothetical protein
MPVGMLTVNFQDENLQCNQTWSSLQLMWIDLLELNRSGFPLAGRHPIQDNNDIIPNLELRVNLNAYGKL